MERSLDVQTSYDRIAGPYTEHIFQELQHKPLDRTLLDQFAERVQGWGPVCDLGCGPGHIARYLHERGVAVCGIDLSPGMVAQAQQLNPGIAFRQGNLLALEVADAAWGGIAAFYSILHIPREEVVRALRELKRVLRPGGWLLLAFHLGEEVVHREEMWGEPVCLDFVFFRADEMRGYLAAAGFGIEETIERAPYEGVEYPSRRAYIFAKRPEERSER